MPDKNYIGWDIGGAHLKMAYVHADGAVSQVEQHATPLWQGLGSLRSRLIDISLRLPVDGLTHVVTTTGELADLFQDRQEGVQTLLSEFCQVYDSGHVLVYAGPAGLIPAAEAAEQYQQVASANWHATAEYVAGRKEEGILVDIGSSTTDLIPFKGGKLCHRGYSDQERLRYDELLYTGMVRTPLMAIVRRLPCAGEWQTMAAEQFATMADVYRITGELDESSDLLAAADGGGKEILDSIRRVARMLGEDIRDASSNKQYYHLARYLAEEQIHMINQSLHRVISTNPAFGEPCLIGAGVGRSLAAKLAARNNYLYTNFEQILDVNENQQTRAADCATAVSVAQLARLAG